jgi:hypothetical protein
LFVSGKEPIVAKITSAIADNNQEGVNQPLLLLLLLLLLLPLLLLLLDWSRII